MGEWRRTHDFVPHVRSRVFWLRCEN